MGVREAGSCVQSERNVTAGQIADRVTAEVSNTVVCGYDRRIHGTPFQPRAGTMLQSCLSVLNFWADLSDGHCSNG